MSATWEEVRGALQERLRLLSLEAQRSGLALVQLVLYGVMAAVLVVTAWLTLMGGVTVWLVLHAGLHWVAAVIGIVVLNLIAAALLAAAMRKLVPQLGFPATVRQLRNASRGSSDVAPPS
ncbi:MAG TPA: phage holin family protein [Burkholderiaceae bacterium]|nr:phage holin family protein [Burkholderiaceae bacterium]